MAPIYEALQTRLASMATGSLAAVSPEAGRQRMQDLPPERRALYEAI